MAEFKRNDLVVWVYYARSWRRKEGVYLRKVRHNSATADDDVQYSLVQFPRQKHPARVPNRELKLLIEEQSND